MKAKALGAAIVLALGAAAADAQPPAPLALNACHVSPIVENLDVAAAFYHGVLGLDLMPPPPAGPLPVDTDAGHLRLHGLPQSRLRFIQARIPGVRCGIEIVEWTNVERTPVHRRYQDPGSATLVLTVRDIDAAFAAVTRSGARVVTTGGKPIRVTPPGGSSSRALTVQDPDAHYIELVQPDRLPETKVVATSNVIGIALRLTVADVDESVAFYRRVLGIEGQVRAPEGNQAFLDVAGLPRAGEVRSGFVPIPGTSRTLELVQFRGLDARTSAERSRVQDPGSYRLQLTFRDIDAALQALRASGRETVTTGGGPITMTFGGGRPWKLAVVPDPNNLFLIVQEAPSDRPSGGL